MPRHIWTVMCRRCVTDAETNTVSLFDVLEELTVEAKETLDPDKWVGIPFETTFVSLFARSDPAIGESAKLKLDIVSPKGDRFDGTSQAINVDLVKHQRARAMIRMDAIPFRGVGIYEFIFSIAAEGTEWKRIIALPFTIKGRQPTQEVAAKKSATTKPKSRAKT